MNPSETRDVKGTASSVAVLLPTTKPKDWPSPPRRMSVDFTELKAGRSIVYPHSSPPSSLETLKTIPTLQESKTAISFYIKVNKHQVQADLVKEYVDGTRETLTLGVDFRGFIFSRLWSSFITWSSALWNHQLISAFLTLPWSWFQLKGNIVVYVDSVSTEGNMAAGHVAW